MGIDSSLHFCLLGSGLLELIGLEMPGPQGVPNVAIAVPPFLRGPLRSHWRRMGIAEMRILSTAAK
jgi:hypothetical protein